MLLLHAEDDPKIPVRLAAELVDTVTAAGKTNVQLEVKQIIFYNNIRYSISKNKCFRFILLISIMDILFYTKLIICQVYLRNICDLHNVNYTFFVLRIN